MTWLESAELQEKTYMDTIKLVTNIYSYLAALKYPGNFFNIVFQQEFQFKKYFKKEKSTCNTICLVKSWVFSHCLNLSKINDFFKKFISLSSFIKSCQKNTL